MQESTYPGGTAALPAAPSKKPIVAALVALIVGGAAATGVWWLTDNDVDILPEPATKVIVTQPVEPGAGTAAKDEAAIAAAVGGSGMEVNPSTGHANNPAEQQYEPSPGASGFGKDEAATAGAVGSKD